MHFETPAALDQAEVREKDAACSALSPRALSDPSPTLAVQAAYRKVLALEPDHGPALGQLAIILADERGDTRSSVRLNDT